MDIMALIRAILSTPRDTARGAASAATEDIRDFPSGLRYHMSEDWENFKNRGDDPYNLSGKRDDTLDMIRAIGDYQQPPEPLRDDTMEMIYALNPELRGINDRGDDPYGLAGKRDDTMDMILALAGSEGAPPPPQGALTQGEENWANFLSNNEGYGMEKVGSWGPPSIPEVPIQVQRADDTRGTGMPGQDYVPMPPDPIGPASSLGAGREALGVLQGLLRDAGDQTYGGGAPSALTPDEERWADFLATGNNENLDLEKVAQQAGGKLGTIGPEGAITSLSEGYKLPKAQSDEELFRYVREDIPRMDAMDMLDPRSRDYAPDAAKILLDSVSQDKRAEADLSYSDSQNALAAIQGRQFDYAQSLGGRIDSALQALGSMGSNTIIPPEVPGLLLMAKDRAVRGDEQGADQLFLRAMQLMSPQDETQTRPEAEKKGRKIKAAIPDGNTDMIFVNGQWITP